MTEKKTFLLYHDQCEIFSELSDDDAGQLIKAIIKSSKQLAQSHPVEPSGLSGLLSAIYKPFLSHLIRDYGSWLSICERNKSNGMRGGRKKNKPSRPQSPPVKADTDTDTDTDNIKAKNKYSEEFEDFWKQYPRGEKKAPAFISWKKAINKTSPEEIIKALLLYIKHKPDYQDFAHATTWLNSERWEDEYKSTVSINSRGGAKKTI